MEIAYILGKVSGQTLAEAGGSTPLSHYKGTLLPFQFQELNYSHEERMSHLKLTVLQPYSPKYWQVC